MQWTIRLEARTGWGDTETDEIGTVSRRVTGQSADDVGLLLDEAKAVLAELRRRMVQSQVDEQVTCARVCSDCLRMRRIRDRRTRTLQTLFGTVSINVPRLKLCICVDAMGFRDVSFSPLSKLLPDRCTPELRRLQVAVGARHSFREASRILSTFLPCSPPNHASVRNRLYRIAADLDATDAAAGGAPPKVAERPKDPGVGGADRRCAHPRGPEPSVTSP